MTQEETSREIPERIIIRKRKDEIQGLVIVGIPASDVWMDYKIYQQMGTAKNDDGTWIPIYGEGMADNSEVMEDSTPLIEGFIKWDGCRQFSFWHHEENVVQLHFDDLEDSLWTMRMAMELIDEVGRKLPAWMDPIS